MQRSLRKAFLGFGVAVLAVGVAVLVRWLLNPVLGESVPFPTLYGAVAIAVAFGGWRPALFATVLGYLAVNYLVIEPRGTIAIPSAREFVSLCLYVMSCLIIVGFGEGMRAARRNLERKKQALQENEQRRSARLAVTQILAQSLTLEEAGPKVLHALCDGLGWDVGALWVVATDGAGLRCRTVWHAPSVQADEFAQACRDYTMTAGLGLPGRVWSTGKPAWIPDVDEDRNFPRSGVARQAGLHGAFGFPILHAGQVLGVVEFFSGEVRKPDLDLLEMVATLGGQIGLFMERRRAVASLQASQQRFARFMQHLPGLAWIKDLEGRYVFANDAAVKAFRTAREDLYGRTDDDVFPPETAAHFKEHDRQAIANRAGMQVIEQLKHEDGILHHSLVSKFPIGGAEGEAVLVGGMAIDITDRLRAEKALQEADRRKDEFLATLAHELRNPLAPIRNALELMKLASDDPALMARARGMMERQLVQMVRLIDDLLDISRITRGKMQLRPERVDVATVLQHAVEASRPLIAAQNHELTVTLPAQPIVLDADPARLAQVVSNLLNNAAKYTDQGGHIWLSAEREGNRVVISVRDTGIGIPSAHLPGLFEIFSQVGSTLERSHGGLGIGLSLVRGLVELHGGTVEVRSEGLGQGSEFVVRLPITMATAAPSETPNGDGRLSRAPHGCRILVVDDNRDAAESLALMLQVMGHTVHTAHDGLEAVEAAATFQPTLALMDIGMPRMNGYEAARHIRQQPWGERMRLVAVSGWGQADDKRRALAAGFDHHLTKPVDPAALEKLLALAVEFPPDRTQN